MNRWTDVLITPDTSILEAIKVIDESSLQIALVVDENRRLLGTVTDGDIRRGILRKVSMEAPVISVMYRSPCTATVDESPENILALMKARQLRQIPLLDQAGRIVGLKMWDDLTTAAERENLVVLMAGGLGSRLGDLTKECPKPLLNVGGRPVMETILVNCLEHGFTRFYISVNYKAEMLKAYFGDGSRWGVQISYLHERERLGTAGSLGLLPLLPQNPVVVMNADLLTKVNLSHLLEFHKSQNSAATMCVREYDFKIPYGVVKMDKHTLIGIEEKPVHRFFVSAGIYVLNPEVLRLIPQNEYFDMPVLFEKLIASDVEIAAFPIREYWLDIGRIDDYELANCEYGSVFT